MLLRDWAKGVEAVTAADFRRIAVNTPEAVERLAFREHRLPSRRKNLCHARSCVAPAYTEQQAGMVEHEPKIFSPVPGGWGKAPHEYAWRKWHRTYWKARCGGMAEQGAEAPLARRIRDLSSSG